MNEKPWLNVVALGHVGSGKSTLLGHLNYRLGGISKPQIEAFERDAQATGKRTFKYAWVFDRLASERQRGGTIFGGSRPCGENPLRNRLHFIDAPGGRRFIRNTCRAIGQADAGLLVVDASSGVFEAGMKAGGQTREHVLIAASLGLQSLVVAVNKMDDKSVNYAEARYNEIKSQLLPLLAPFGFPVERMAYVPVSGYIGDHLQDRSVNMKWYMGPLLEAALDDAAPALKSYGKALRLIVAGSFRIAGIGTVLAGKVAGGVLKPGMKVRIGPLSGAFETGSIEVHGKSRMEAVAGDVVGVLVKGLRPGEVRRGWVLSDAESTPAKLCSSFGAFLAIRDCPTRIGAGYSPTISFGAATVPCRIEAILSEADFTSRQPVGNQPASLKNGMAAIVRITPMKPLCVEKASEYPALGRFVMLDSRRTVGTGIVRDIRY